MTGVDISPLSRICRTERTRCTFHGRRSGSTSQAGGQSDGGAGERQQPDFDRRGYVGHQLYGARRLMAQVITPGEEPITPFISRVRGCMKILVYPPLSWRAAREPFPYGGHYYSDEGICAIDITQKAKEAAAACEDRERKMRMMRGSFRLLTGNAAGAGYGAAKGRPDQDESHGNQ